MYVPTHAGTAILHVLEGTTWARNETRQVWTGLLVTPLKLVPMWTARARRFYMRIAFMKLESTAHHLVQNNFQ